jgi:hypothetical protein
MLVNAADIVSSLPSFLGDILSAVGLDKVWLVPLTVKSTADALIGKSGIALDEPVALSISGLDAVSLVIGAAGDDTIFPFTVQILPELQLSLEIGVALRLSSTYLKPVVQNPADGSFAPDPTRTSVDISRGTVGLSISGEGKFGVTLNQAFSLDEPVMVGDSGVVIQASGVSGL